MTGLEPATSGMTDRCVVGAASLVLAPVWKRLPV